MPVYDYPRPAVTADVVLLVGPPDARKVLLVERRNEPFKGMWALPGGFLDQDERPVDAARRELLEETGIHWRDPLLEVGAFGEPGRDPRGWTVSIAWTAWSPHTLDARGGDDAVDACWFPVDDMPALAFDHQEIIERALDVVDRTSEQSGRSGS